MKAAIYARRSPTSENSVENETIKDQTEKNTKFILKNGDTLVDVYSDDLYSGHVERTPDFDRLLEDAKLGRFKRVYIREWGRIARDESNRLGRVKLLMDLNIELFIGGEPLDKTSQGEMVNGVMGNFRQWEAAEIVRRTTNGRWRQARAGKIIASKTRFGYKLFWQSTGEDGKQKKTVVIDEAESKIVLKMYDMIFETRSCHQIAKKLLEEGIKTRFGKNWDSTTVKGVLTDITYTGNWHYGKRLATEPKKRKTKYYRFPNTSAVVNPNKEEIIHYKIPAIISEEKFNAVQELLKEFNKRRVETPNRFYLLNGILRCSKCGAKMYGRTLYDKRYDRNYLYYYCSTNSKPFHKAPCTTKQVRGKAVEATVWNAVQSIFNEPENVLSCNKTYLNENFNSDKIVIEKKALLAELEKIRQNKIKQLELYEADDVMDKAIVKERLNFWATKEQEVKKSLAVIEKSATSSEMNKHVIENIKEYGELMKLDFEAMSEVERKELLVGMLFDVVFNPDNREVNVVGSLSGIDSPDLLSENIKPLK